MELPRSHEFLAGTVTLDDGEICELMQGSAPPADPVIVVGGGPSGLRSAQELTRRGLPVVLFNAERWQPYNRVKLTPFMAGEVQLGRVYQADLFLSGANITQYNGQTIVGIDRDARTVVNQFGRSFRYSKLVLSMGSHPYIPPIPGRELSGVFRFRNFDDVEKLVARGVRSRRTVVIGGGLLGLEAARGMSMRHVPTIIVEHEAHLMARQLDDAGGDLLRSVIEGLSLGVRTGCSVKAIEGDGRVERIRLSTGETIACDTIVICTGIRPNIALAADAGIAVGRGITVNDVMQTSDPDIYAVGECAEHDGVIYGLVAPGLEQAAVAAAHIAGAPANYRGSVPTTKLKVVGTDVFSMGDVEQLDQRIDVRAYAWHDEANACYRRIVVSRWRLVGALGVGAWPEVSRIQQAVQQRELMLPWQRWRFVRTGRLHRDVRPESIAAWPAAATVCNCTGVTRGQLGQAVAKGCTTTDALMRETGASTVCGTCRPLLQELLGSPGSRQAVFGASAIATASIAAGLAALAAILLPAWPYSRSVDAAFAIDQLWISGTWKQVTGFTLLALAVFVALLSLRKRLNFNWLGNYRLWRVLHGVVGAATLAVLFVHTGFNLGHNLNRWLMIAFLAIIAAGSVTGFVMAREHAMPAGAGASWRNSLTWIHILLVWPFPLLLFLHVLTVYAY